MFLGNIYVCREYWILEQFGTEHYTWRPDKVQNLCELWQFFLSDFLSSKCFNNPKLYTTATVFGSEH